MFRPNFCSSTAYHFFILFVFLFFLSDEKSAFALHQYDKKSENKIPSEQKKVKLLTSIQILADTNCTYTLEEAMANWSLQASFYENFSKWYFPFGENNCYWSRLMLRNQSNVSRTCVLYFPNAWNSLECFIVQKNGEYAKKLLSKKPAIISIEVPALETKTMLVRYPTEENAFLPTLNVSEMTEEEYASHESRSNYKFFLTGLLIFPLLFFLARLLVEKNLLAFAYLIFLLGAALNLITLLDATPYFSLTPKFISNLPIIQRLFLTSILFILIGLVKYIHYLLEVKNWSPRLVKVGNVMLLAFSVIVIIPFIQPQLFGRGSYENYLQYFRIGTLLIFIYVMTLCLIAVAKKVRFSNILLLAFSPFILSALVYALSFIILRKYSASDIESIILIFGFFLTILLFGLILGVRNNAVKAEKILLEEKTKNLQELDHFKSRFYTNFTHEFRTPLTVINGIAAEIEGNSKHKNLIQRNSERLLNIVNQLLEISKIENNSLNIDWIQDNVINYLQYLTESCSSLAEKKRINLAFFSFEERLMMDFDAVKLQQIVINIVSNAIKFTPEFGTVKVIAKKVVEDKQSFLQITVSDTGQGIPEDQLPHIFNRFYQVDDSDTRKAEGTGIGLALVKELIHILKGRIDVESELEKGTKFLVYLPIHQNARMADAEIISKVDHIAHIESGSIEESPISDAAGTDDHGKPIILVIEDNIDVTDYIFSCLRKNFKLYNALNGKKGIEKALEIIPDVIICDVMMPEMDGFAVCKQLKTDRRTSHIPIMLLTAKATREDRLSGLSQGADAYLTKPFDKEELLVRLNNLSALSIRLRHLITSSDTEQDLDEPGKRESMFLKEVKEVIESNLENEQFDTLHLCREVGMSRTQLHRKLKALTGISTASFIKSHRLSRAKYLLETTDLPIGTISLQVGYKDFSHFSRNFAREFGHPPSQLRK